jgi:hypothetical protein
MRHDGTDPRIAIARVGQLTHLLARGGIRQINLPGGSFVVLAFSSPIFGWEAG